MKRVSLLFGRVLLGVVLGTALFYTVVFLPKIFNNMHRSYLRYKMKDVVYVTNLTSTGGGTGWITTTKSGRKVIITNTHVCKGAGFNGQVKIDHSQIVDIIKEFPQHDLCAIAIPSDRDTNGFSIAKSVEYGEEVFTLGHPLLQPSTVSPGELSGPYITRISVGENVDPATCTGETYELIQDKEQIGFGIIFGIYNYSSGMSVQIFIQICR